MLSAFRKPVDNTPLVLFRIALGFLMSAESFGAIATGWVRRTLAEPEITFSFIPFPWLQPLPGDGMYYYFALMGLAGLGVMAGYRYRWSATLFALMWTAVYFMQKTHYNNHYYMLTLLAWIMVFLPAHYAVSADTRKNPTLYQNHMAAGSRWIIVGLAWIMYTYAAVAKIYPDWLNGTYTGLLLSGKQDTPLVGHLFNERWFHFLLVYGGLLYDLLIIPALFLKRTRIPAFLVSLLFHLFNSLVFQIGIFPYLALAFALFFFPPETLRRIFLRRSQPDTGPTPTRTGHTLMPAIVATFLAVQLLLPLRHWFIPGEVFWTEEGHRLSWRMMLRNKSGDVQFRIVDPQSGKSHWFDTGRWLNADQQHVMSTHPDIMWQFVQFIKTQEPAGVGIYAYSRVSLNGRTPRPLVSPQTDMARAQWSWWKHAPWITPFPGWQSH